MVRRSWRLAAQAMLVPLVLLSSSLTNGTAAAAAAPARTQAKFQSAHGQVQVQGRRSGPVAGPNGQAAARPARAPRKIAPAESPAGASPGTPGVAKHAATPGPFGQAPSTRSPSVLAPTVGGTFTAFNEFADTSLIPPDSAIAVGPFQVVVIVNSVVKVFSKNGTQLSSTSLNTFFSPAAGSGDFIFDPRAFFDPDLGRFWVFATSENDSSGPGDTNRSFHLLALSDSDDVGGNVASQWSRFGIDATLEGNTPNNRWCDYPMLGVDADDVFLSCNMFDFPSTNGGFEYAKVRVMGKSQFVNNTCCSWTDVFDMREGFLNTAHSFTVHPAHEYGASSGEGEWLVDAHTFCILCTPHTLEVWHFTRGANGIDVDSDSIDVGNYPDPPQARQPGGPNNIDAGDTRLLFAFWKSGHLSTGQTIGCPNSGDCAAYTELDVSGGLGSMSVVNDFFFGDDGKDRMYPAVDVNAAGDKSMVYSISGPSTFVAASFVGIPRSSTCTNCVDGPDTTLAGGNSDYQQFDCTPGSPGCSPRNRWGDYSSAAADPDGTGVWVHGEFSGASNSWGTVVGLTREAQDTTPPVTTATVAPTPVSGWNRSGVIVTLNATDSQSGVRSITYSVSGAESVPTTTVNSSVVFVGLQNEGVSTIQFQATDNWGNQEAANFQTVRIDKTAPTVSCTAPDSVWHAADQASSCSGFDGLSGLANPGDVSFVLKTSVPAGTETAFAFTNTHDVCDVAGNCTTAGPIGPFMVDKKAPVISITAPSATVYTLHQVVSASYTCTDGGSGVASCAGPVPSGASIDTSTVGFHSFTVTAVDNVGNQSTQTVTYVVTYAICLLYDAGTPRAAGVYTFRIALCDAFGTNVSSNAVTVHATLITPGGMTPTSNSQPTNDFDTFPGSGSTGGYIYVLSSKNLSSGSYELHVSATGDPIDHALPFAIK
jgi:hypothetical protein